MRLYTSITALTKQYCRRILLFTNEVFTIIKYYIQRHCKFHPCIPLSSQIRAKRRILFILFEINNFLLLIIMDQIFGKVGSYWFNQKATKELDTVGNNINVRWIITKLFCLFSYIFNYPFYKNDTCMRVCFDFIYI